MPALRQDLNIIQSGPVCALRNAFNPNLIAGTYGDTRNHAPRRGRAVQLARRETIVGSPFGDELIRNPQLEMRDAVRHIEIADVDGVPTGGAVIFERGCASGGATLHGLSARCRFPWNWHDRRVAF